MKAKMELKEQLENIFLVVFFYFDGIYIKRKLKE